MEEATTVGIIERFSGNDLRIVYEPDIRLRVGDRYTREHPCHSGLRQGCPMSPLLFALFTPDIQEYVKQECVGVVLGEDSVCMMCYADDILLMAQTAQDLQHQIQGVTDTCEAGGLKVNPKKSAVMWTL